MSLEKDISELKVVFGGISKAKNLPDTLIEKLKRLPNKEYLNVDFVMKDGTLVENIKIHEGIEVFDDRDINLEDVDHIGLRFRNPLFKVHENVIVQNALAKSHDFPAGIFWYDLGTNELDYEPYRDGLNHNKTKGYDKHSTNKLVIRGRLFREGTTSEKIYMILYAEEIKFSSVLKDKLNDLYNKASKASGFFINGIVDMGGADLIERKK